MAGEERFDELDPVMEEQRHAVARPHATGSEHGGEARRAGVERGVRPDLIAEDECGVVRMGPARPAGQLWQHQSSRLLQGEGHSRRLPHAPGARSGATPATASMRAPKNSAIVGRSSVWSGRYQCQMLL